MGPPLDLAPLVHGGDLDAARKLFPGAHEPFLDLSTGINPNSYPVPQLPSDVFAKLPEPGALAALAAIAAKAYGAASSCPFVAGSGSQILVAQASFLLPHPPAAVLSPPYAEHGR